MGGHVAAGISGYGEFAGQIKSGKLRALAISRRQRLAGIDIPTLKEHGVDVEMVNWRAIFGAPGITDAQKKELHDVVAKAVKTASWQETLKRNDWPTCSCRATSSRPSSRTTRRASTRWRPASA